MAAREMRVTRENFILIEFGGGVAEGLLGGVKTLGKESVEV